MEGQKLKRLIREKFGSQANFARAAGISEPTLTQLLKMSIVGGVNALRIQRVLDQSKKREGVSMNNDHLRIDKFTGDYEIPRNLISRVIGHLLNLAIQNELARPGKNGCIQNC